MANKSIEMSKVRQIMKLYTQHMGKKKIAERLGVSKNTVKQYVDMFIGIRRTWDDLSKLTDFELNKLFHPPKRLELGTKKKQLYDFFPEMEKHIRRRGMTLQKQFRVYKELYPDGYNGTMFYTYYQRWKKQSDPSLPIEHFIGDKMYVDFAGETLSYIDVETGEVKEAQVFISVLGWSLYAYVEALANQTVEEFIHGCENALHYFKGVPLAVVPDNLKSAVIKSSKYEPIINENFQAFADHYGIAVAPARSRKPKDKAPVENMVKLAYKEIYTEVTLKGPLPLAELNVQIRNCLVRFNTMHLTGKEQSRRDQWIMEQSFLQALPDTMYELRRIRSCTVMKNGHVFLSEDQHYYSVPYELIGERLKLHYTRTKVEVYKQYEVVAKHSRVKSKHNYSTDKSHLSPQHQYMTEWSPDFFIDRGKAIDPAVAYYIEQVLEKKPYAEQAYKSCQGILSFAKRVGHERLIKACKRAHEFGQYNYRIIEDILKKRLENYEDTFDEIPMPSHENIRGGHYYQ
jgi:transposase